ncbi:MAG: PAS domain-containing protein [bacterium]
MAFLWFSQASKERRNRALQLDSITAGILHIDHQGLVLTCNKQACLFLSVPEKQLRGQNIYQLDNEASLSNRKIFTRFVEMHENRFEGKEIHDLQTSQGLS